MTYELRYSYSPDVPLGKADVRSRHGTVHVHDAAVAFLECSAPYKYIVWEEDGEIYELDEHERAYIEGFAAGAGYEIEEVEG